jgi:hypothetical protein
VPRAAPARREPDRPPPPRRFGATYTLWLLGAQAALAAIGVSCVVGVFGRGEPSRWPEWSYLNADKILLLLAGALFLLAVWAAYHLPVFTTLVMALLALGACTSRYLDAGSIDLSRTLALAVAMLALWLALSHRRAAAR